MRQRGFTLIELLVVVAIIGILGAIAVPRLYGVRGKALAKEAEVFLPLIAAHEVEHFRTHGRYLPAPPNPSTIPETCGGRSVSVWQPASEPPPPAPSYWEDEPAWRTLGFEPVGALCFQYEVEVAPAGFTVHARGGAKVADATFELSGETFEVRRTR